MLRETAKGGSGRSGGARRAAFSRNVVSRGGAEVRGDAENRSPGRGACSSAAPLAIHDSQNDDVAVGIQPFAAPEPVSVLRASAGPGAQWPARAPRSAPPRE